ncbi:Dbl homology domain-containing protein [Syncephalis fuscata]|nr:Dbl homology domain-containing protein [Syncephalis fuscata]
MMVNRDIFERASNMERRRQEAIYELIATEESYVADLEIVDELFYRPMKKLLSRNDFEAVFSNLDAIRVATERLMHVLRRRQWQGQFHVATIGDLFIEKMPSLECYVAYCANHMEATAKLQLLLQTDPRLNHWLKRRQSDPLCRNLDLASFLLQPMQRVTRYALLLRQICSYTPLKHADHTSIRQAVDLAEDLLRRSNEAARDRADLSRLKEIAASLIMDSQAQQLDLTGSTRHLGQRRFVMEGVWIKGRQGRRITAFLFTDLLLLCEPARAQIGMYKPYLDPIPLLELEVRETSGTRSLLRLEDSTFQIVHKKRSLNVKAENAGAKRKWLQTIRECIARCREAHRSNENGWLQAPSLRELTGKVLWAIRVMIVEVTGLTTTTGASKFDHSMLSVYCSVSLNQRQTYRTAVVNTDTTVINNNNNNSAAGVNANMNANTTSVSANSHARWEQAFLFTITDLDDALRVAVYTYDRFSCDSK